MFSSKTVHKISCSIGIIFLSLSIYQAFFVTESQFYTSFALGSWLVLDYTDYKLNNTSILSYFYNHKHRHALYLLFLISFVFCFIVDYLWGVKVVKMWEWTHYSLIEFLRMYLIMNISFVLGMYELYRVIMTLLKTRINEGNTIHYKIPYQKKITVYKTIFMLGVLFLISPILFELFHLNYVMEFIMIFPFISMIFISDSVTYLSHGKPILEELVRFNKLKITSLILTVLIAFIFTEGLNLFGREWKYLRMPFYNFQILTVPVTVMVGWIPLIIGSISMVNMIKHIDYLNQNNKSPE